MENRSLNGPQTKEELSAKQWNINSRIKVSPDPNSKGLFVVLSQFIHVAKFCAFSAKQILNRSSVCITKTIESTIPHI